MDDQPLQEVYFIGIALPPKLNASVASLAWTLYEEKQDMLKPLVPHVTLLHPPSLQGFMPSELIPIVRSIASRYLPLTLELSDIAFFGRQVAYLKVESLKLYSLQSHLVSLLPEEAKKIHYIRPYLPHITIAQKYQPSELEPAEIAKTVRSRLSLPLTFEVNSISCFNRIKPREYATKPIN